MCEVLRLHLLFRKWSVNIHHYYYPPLCLGLKPFLLYPQISMGISFTFGQIFVQIQFYHKGLAHTHNYED